MKLAYNAYPVATGGDEVAIRRDLYHHQFCADVAAEQAVLMAATQRPATLAALSEELPAEHPAGRRSPGMPTPVVPSAAMLMGLVRGLLPEGRW